MEQMTLGGCRHFQIGYVVRDVDEAIRAFEAVGARLLDRIEDMRDDAGEPMMIRNLSHLEMGEREIELIEAREGWPSVYSDWPLGEGGVAVHHMGFTAADDAQWEAAAATLLGGRFEPAMSVDIPRIRVVYYDTRRVLGHYTEIVQRRG